MGDRGTRAWPLAVLIAALFLVLTPAVAHEERHSAPAAREQPSTQAGSGGHDMSNRGAAPTEMKWPTAEDMKGMAGHEERPKTFTGRLVRWLGAWHPAVVHFPVALLLTVAFLEVAAAVRRKPAFRASNRILLAIAALSAFVAAPLGWISAGLPNAEDKFALTIHRWLGTALPLLFLLLWVLKRPENESVLRERLVYHALLATAVAAIIAQAYFGAEITHGAEHLAF